MIALIVSRTPNEILGKLGRYQEALQMQRHALDFLPEEVSAPQPLQHLHALELAAQKQRL